VVFRVDAGNLEACKEATGGFPLNKELQVARWSKVVFNFPHLGAGHKDESRNILSNQLMLIRFLVSVAPLLSRGPVPSYMSSKGKARKGSADSEPEEEVEESEIESEEPRKDGFCVPPHAGSLLITVRNCKPYTMWDIPTLAKRLPSVAGTIIKTAPAMGKGLKAPSSEQIEKVLSLGQGKAYRVWRSFRFSPEQYTLYSHRRTIGWKQGRSTDDNEDILRPGQQQNDREIRTFELGLAD
jgi:25S rRNA (uracil2634-N3)-methyltransferase